MNIFVGQKFKSLLRLRPITSLPNQYTSCINSRLCPFSAGTTLRDDGHVMRIKPKSVAPAAESLDAVDTSAASSGGGSAAAAPAESWTPEKKDAPTQQQTSTTTTTTTTSATTTVGGPSFVAAVAMAMANSAVQVRPLRELLGCQDKSMLRRTAQRGDYWVLYNYVPARRWFRCDESITYTTHADFTFLDNLEPLLNR